ncbi:hypothetical protein SynA15127_00854 [Synechococcus sp. A15-127]|uniref:hypothetical protein n=1 Tax=Synechococcus sp. A15-127 TaxID=1050624 RepID=UPI001644E924|nr:hypothetical protein [Synechococcus sp. A15-127]QNI93942.1 hypothetical protein SynA15127_00854 [Synechococcus sp. A15-127]
MSLYKGAEQMARHDRRTISQWFRVAVEGAIKAQRKRLKEEGVTLPEPSTPKEVIITSSSQVVQAALKDNPDDDLLKDAAQDIDVLGGIKAEKLQKLKLLMDLLDS